MGSIAELYSAAWEGLLAAEQDAWQSQDAEQLFSGSGGGRGESVAALEEFRRSWMRKHNERMLSLSSRSRVADGGAGEDEADWHGYEPPAALRQAPGVTARIWLDMLPTSIENVRSRITRRDRVNEEEEARTAVEDVESWPDTAVRRDKGKIPDDASSTASPTAALSSRCIDDGAGTRRRSKFSIGCFSTRTHEGQVGESSATGGTLRKAKGKGNTFIQRLGLETRLGLWRPDSTAAAAKTRMRRFMTGLLRQQPVECVSCLDEFAPTEPMIRVPCRHKYCPECFVRLIAAALENEQQWPPKCCLTRIPGDTIMRSVPDEMGRRFLERSPEWDMRVSERIYCHEPKCGAWVEPRGLDRANRLARCHRNHVTCTICRQGEHGGGECPADRDLQLTNQLAGEQGWKRCYACGALIEHSDSCRHMTCLCGAQFCYVCGGVWRTCECTEEQMLALKRAAERSRVQRMLRERAEALELRKMRVRIEAREREEAREAERRRMEQQVREEERQRREMEERAERELRRRRGIEGRFEQLREQLDRIHEMQRVAMRAQQEEERRVTTEEAEAAETLLLREQEASWGVLASWHEARARNQEADFAKELWYRGTRPGASPSEGFRGSNGLGEAMTMIWQEMDQAYREWEERKRERVDVLGREMREEHAAHKMTMDRRRLDLEQSWREAQKRSESRAAAEERWLQEVVLERERLLRRLEVEEMEGR